MSELSELKIVELDPFDDPAFEAWWRSYRDAEVHDRGETGTVWQLEELRAQMQSPGRRLVVAGWSGLVGDEVVSTAFLGLPQLDNRHRANLAVTTVGPHRRRGHGSAMLAAVVERAAAADRTLLLAETYWAHDLGPDGVGAPGREFARHHGFELALGDIQRRLPLPIDEAVLDELAAAAAPHHEGYTLRSWTGRTPEDVVIEMAEMAAVLMTEAPTGELDLEPQSADVEALREDEDLVEQQGRTKLVTAAFDAEGRMAAYTDLVTTVHEPDRAYQWGTLVRHEHRGHRLGLAVKVANLRLLQRDHPGVTQLSTFNAEVNDHMVAVNDRLGFVPVERLGELQRRL